MVFGYYHISMRSFSQQEVPLLQIPPRSRIAQKIKVGHILWIPFIPLDKVWVLELADGRMMKLDFQTINTLEQKFGKKSTPWYSFLGIIAIFVLPFLMNFSQSVKRNTHQKKSTSQTSIKHKFEQKLNNRLDKINNPTNDYLFFFLDESSKRIAIKVNRNTTDSIYFLAPLDNENKKWTKSNWAAGYYASKNPTKEVAFSKEDLKKTFPNQQNESMYKKGMLAEALPIAGLIKLDEIRTINKNTITPIIDAAETAKIKTGFNAFLKYNSNLDSLLQLIDKESINYYKTNLQLAVEDDDKIVRKLRKNSMKDPCLYELLLYTRYVYLKLEASPQLVKKAPLEKVITNEKLKDYLFFLKLLDKGILHLDKVNFKFAQITTVSILQKNRAKIAVTMPSNLLKESKSIHFWVNMTKEKGRWKVNLPSGYSYTNRQIQSNYTYRSEIDAQWREMVRKNITDLSDGRYIHDDWNY